MVIHMRDFTHAGSIFGSADGSEQNVMEEEHFSNNNKQFNHSMKTKNGNGSLKKNGNGVIFMDQYLFYLYQFFL